MSARWQKSSRDCWVPAGARAPGMKKGPRGPLSRCKRGAQAPCECSVAVAAAAVTAAAATTAAAAAVTAATTTTAVATTTEAATAARRTGLHWASLVDDQVTAADRLAVHTLDRRLGFGIAAHFDKAEALGAPGVALHHDLGAGDGTELAECLLHVFVAERIGQIAHVKFVAHKGLLKMTKKRWSPIPAINKPVTTSKTRN